jgi:hypothetical protein
MAGAVGNADKIDPAGRPLDRVIWRLAFRFIVKLDAAFIGL